jgi:hypothetical protein
MVDINHRDVDSIMEQVSAWIYAFGYEFEMERTLNLAIFYAHKVWLGGVGSSYSAFDDTRRIRYTEGNPTFKSSLSTQHIIVGSVLKGIHLLGLLALAIYTFVMKPWIPWLGSEVMIKMGTAFAGSLSAAQDEKEWEDTAQACPGFIGDDNPTEGVGNMRFGATAGLDTKYEKKFTKSFA